MDLICIKRRYRNIRRLIVFSFIITVFVCAFFITDHVYAEKRKAKIWEEDFAAVSKVLKELEEQEKQKEAEENAQKQPKTLSTQEIESINSIYKTEKKRVFLTFDDGPSKKVTIPILDLLKQENIKANFFVLGSRVELYPDIVKRAYEEGHYIANHGYSHQYSQIYSSTSAVLDEYNKTNQAVKNAIGNQAYSTNIFRFPGGSVGGKYNDLKSEAKDLLVQNNIASVDWNALNGDAEGLKTEEALLNRLKETVQGKNSVVVLMHDAADKTKTYNVLPQVIEYLRQEGYEFKTFYDILDE